MVLNCRDIFKILPVIRLEFYDDERSFFIKTFVISEILTFLKCHFSYNYKILTCISGVDYPEKSYRFQVVYELLSLRYNSRMNLKVLVDELTPINTAKNVYDTATWWECEIWDMFGVFFLNQYHLVRLLTDYGFQGHPLRKDFPLTGFLETRYNYPKNRVAYETVELAQEYRVFECLSPWKILFKSFE